MTKSPSTYVNVDNIRVLPGESLTVWLVVSEYPLHQIQVELNSRMDYKRLDSEHGAIGIPSIYTHLNRVSVRDFEDWKSEENLND